MARKSKRAEYGKTVGEICNLSYNFGGEMKTALQIRDILTAEGHDRQLIDWYLFCAFQQKRREEKKHMDDPNEERTFWQQLRDHYGQMTLVLEQWQKEVGRGPGGRELAIAKTNIETGWLWIMSANQTVEIARETQVETAEMPPE